MVGFGLLCGHLLGDYILQNDWMARNKVNQLPGPGGDYHQRWKIWWTGHLACTAHCLLYTLAVWLCSCWWMPMWGLAVCFAMHWPIDRFRLARRWMVYVSGQKEFATGALSPWSIIIVDNVFHLLTLFAIGLVVFSTTV